MIATLRKTLQAFSMVKKGDRVLIALSGGKDSVALLHGLTLLREELGLALFACHVNHHIREKSETDEDIALCTRLCGERGIPLVIKDVNIPALSNGRADEDTARLHRYRLLEEAADAFACDRIATAHSATDSAETMLFHLLRGTSGDGLCGIPPVRGRIIRPLIEAAEGDILAFCEEQALPFHTDSTNGDSTYTRNFLRNEVSPLLRQVNPHFERSFSSLASSLRADRAFFEDALPPFSEQRAALASLPTALLTRVLKKEYDSRFAGPLSSRQIGEMADMIVSDSREEKRLSLPDGVTFVCHADTVSFHQGGEPMPLSDSSFSRPLVIGDNPLPNGALLVLSTKGEDEEAARLKNIYKLFICGAMKRTAEVDKMLVRFRVSGERYRFDGMTRSVKKALQAQKLPLPLRRSLPVVADGAGPLWVPFLPVREDLAPKENDERLNIFYCYG